MTDAATENSPALRGLLDRLRSTPRATVIDALVVVVAWAMGTVRIARFGVGFDDVSYATPAQQVTLEAWSDGRMALWSNTIFGGTPHLGNVQTAALYPGHLLSAPFPDLVGPHVQLSLHLLLFGVGMYLLGRRLGFARPAPLVMAVAVMWSGATVFRSPLLVHFPPLAWVPLGMVCVHAVFTSARPRRAAAALSIVLWCILVSGHPQSVLMAFTLLGAWAIGLLLEHRSWRSGGLLAAAGALTLVMAAPVLFALRNSMSAAAASTRGEQALLEPNYVVPLRDLPRLLLGEPFSELFQLYGQGERLTYAGAAIIALGIVGIVAVAAARRWSLVVLATSGIFAMSLSLGPRSPTLRLARAILPGFDQPRVSARWNWVFVMVLIVLAGAGIDRLRQHTFRAGGAATIAVGVGVALSMLVGVNDAGLRNGLLWIAAGTLVVVLSTMPRGRYTAIAGGLLAVLAVFELGMPMVRLIDAGNADITDTSQLIGPTERWLAEQPGLTLPLINGDLDAQYVVSGLRPNANTLAGVRSIDGYDGGVAISRRWHAALLQIIPTFNEFPFGAQLPLTLDPAAFARLGVRYVLYDPARGPAEAAMPGWVHISRPGYFQVYENPTWRGNVTAWFQTQQVGSPEAAGNALRTRRDEFTDTGLVEAGRAVLTCTGDCAPASFRSTSEWSGQRVADVTLDHQALVTFDEQFDRGWSATVDGADADVVAVDGMWAGVLAPAGEHRIELRYEPGWVLPSLVIMLLGWVGVAALGWWPVGRRLR